MERWTMKELAELDSIDFAISILNERRNKVTPYSPLGQKLLNSAHELAGLKGNMDPKSVYVVALKEPFGGSPVGCTKAKDKDDAIRAVSEKTGYSPKTLYAKTVQELQEVLE